MRQSQYLGIAFVNLMKRYRLGCSGWSYADWIGKFYPSDCTQANMLQEYCSHFDTVELNMSFYRLPFKQMVKSWKDRTPDGFIFCPKLTRQITHLKRLKDSEELLRFFLERMSLLDEKLGPILIQLPPGMKPDVDRLEGFLRILPKEQRFAIEFRRREWFSKKIRSLLERYGVATCLIDSPDMTVDDEVTASFAYVRWHGKSAWYAHDYSGKEIDKWARILVNLDAEEVFGYWNNDVDAFAPKNCLSMIKRLKDMS